MANIILDFLKYFLNFFFILFTLTVYYGIAVGDKNKRVFSEKLQMICVFIVQFAGNLIIILNTSDWKMIMFYLMQLIFLTGFYLALLKIYRKASLTLMNIVCMLFTIGLIMITRLDVGHAYRQFFILLAAVIISMLIPCIIRFLGGENILSFILAAAGLAGLILVVIFAKSDGGAKLALSIGKFSLQISEFVKISFVIMCAGFFKDSENKKNLAVGTVMMFMHIIVLVLSRDLGAAFILAATCLMMLFISTCNYGVLVVGGILGAGGAWLAYRFFAHVQTRVDVWLDPWKDILGDGWQILQSLFAIGSGGWSGSGLYNGSPESIPIVLKDFIFAALSEEMGAIAAICVMFIYLAFVIKIFLMAARQRAPFAKLVVAGFACLIGVQTILNIGGVIKFIPSTGVTLPYISYGGSSIMSMFIIYGFIQGFYLDKMAGCDNREKRMESRAEEKI